MGMPRRRLGSLVAVGCWLSFQAANAFIPSTRPVSISLLSRPAERCRRSIPLYASVEDKTVAAGEEELVLDADGKEAVFNFERRLKEAGVVADGLEHALFWEGGDVAPSRGVKALKDFAAGSTLVELPRGQAICLDEGERTPFSQWVPQKNWEKLPWYGQLALKVIYERKMAGNLFKAAYVALLPPPGSMSTPFHWSEADLSALATYYPALGRRVEKQKKTWADMYVGLGKTRAVREDIDEDTFVWALECVLSRAFKGTFGTGLRSLVPSALLMALFAGVYEWDQEGAQLLSYGLEEFPQLAAVPAVLTLLPLIIEFFRSKGTYVMAPMVDSINHVSTLPTEVEFDSLRQRFKIKVNKAFQKGEQVFMSYGSKANDDLLINYGFVETDNAADTFEFPDLLAWMLQHRPDVINKDRTETLFSKGLQDFVKFAKIGRKGRIVQPELLEGLRLLLSTDDELRAENDIVESIIQTPMFMTNDDFEDSVFKKALTESGTEVAVYEALAEVCKEERERLQLSADEWGRLEDAVAKRRSQQREGAGLAPLLLLRLRQEKLRLLDEAVEEYTLRAKEAARAAAAAARGEGGKKP